MPPEPFKEGTRHLEVRSVRKWIRSASQADGSPVVRELADYHQSLEAYAHQSLWRQMTLAPSSEWVYRGALPYPKNAKRTRFCSRRQVILELFSRTRVSQNRLATTDRFGKTQPTSCKSMTVARTGNSDSVMLGLLPASLDCRFIRK